MSVTNRLTMGSRLALITTFLLVALSSAILADSYPNFHKKAALGVTLNMRTNDNGDGTCNNGLGETSNSSRRALAEASHLSYDVLNKDTVPCNQRGASYYNCAGSGKANPYQRACNSATKCARF